MLGTLFRSRGSVCGSQAEMLGRADNGFDAVWMATFPIGPWTAKTIKHDARKSLQKVLNTEKLQVKNIKEHVYVGNPRGLDLVSLSERLDAEKSSFSEKITALEQKIATEKAAREQMIAAEKAALEQKIGAVKDLHDKALVSLKQKNEHLEQMIAAEKDLHDKTLVSLQQKTTTEKTLFDKKLASLEQTFTRQKEIFELKYNSKEERLRTLLDSNESYPLMRDRYISIYRRDRLHNDTKKDRRIIAEGNTTVHGGDLVSDASLYLATSTRRRNDPSVFKKLYGVHPNVVDKIGWSLYLSF